MKLALWFWIREWLRKKICCLAVVVSFLKKKANLNSPDARVFSCFCLLKLYPSLSSRQAAMAMVGQGVRQQREEGEEEQVRSSVPSSASWLDLIATWWGKHFLLPQGRRSRWRRLSSIISLVCPSSWPCSLCHLLVALADNKFWYLYLYSVDQLYILVFPSNLLISRGFKRLSAVILLCLED